MVRRNTHNTTTVLKALNLKMGIVIAKFSCKYSTNKVQDVCGVLSGRKTFHCALLVYRGQVLYLVSFLIVYIRLGARGFSMEKILQNWSSLFLI